MPRRNTITSRFRFFGGLTTVNIKEDVELKTKFIERLQERCAPKRTEIHVTDLTWCLQKSYRRRFQNKKLTTSILKHELNHVYKQRRIK